MHHLLSAIIASLALSTAAPAAAAPAAASTVDEPSPSWGASLRFAPYKPRMGGSTESQYYEAFFGKGQHLLWELQLDRFVTDLYGPLGVFVRSGRWSVSSKNKQCFDGAGASVDCTPDQILQGDVQTGNGSSTLSIMPITLGVEYRAAILQRGFGIPLVPYANVAFDYFLWSAAGEGGSAADNQSGGTAGLEATVGLALNFNVFGRGTGGKVFQNGYFFAEATQIWGDGFGNALKMDMSARQFALGIAFEFE